MNNKKFQEKILRVLILMLIGYNENELLHEVFTIWAEAGISTKMIPPKK